MGVKAENFGEYVIANEEFLSIFRPLQTYRSLIYSMSSKAICFVKNKNLVVVSTLKKFARHLARKNKLLIMSRELLLKIVEKYLEGGKKRTLQECEWNSDQKSSCLHRFTQ